MAKLAENLGLTHTDLVDEEGDDILDESRDRQDKTKEWPDGKFTVERPKPAAKKKTATKKTATKKTPAAKKK